MAIQHLVQVQMVIWRVEVVEEEPLLQIAEKEEMEEMDIVMYMYGKIN